MINMKMSAIIFSEAYNTINALTVNRPVASLPFGGRYRLIDFVLSNIVNSGISRVGVITESNYRSLMDHLGSCSEWDLDRKNSGLHFLAPYSSRSSGGHYRGKIDQLSAAVDFLEEFPSDHVVLADPVTVCNIDLREVLSSHLASGADVTVVADRAKHTKENIYKLVIDGENGRPTAFYVDHEPQDGQFESMGIYVLSRELLIEKVRDLAERGFYDFERDLIQGPFNRGELDFNIYEFSGVVLRNNTIEHYLKNNLLLTDETTRSGVFRKDRPIYTRVRDEVPAYYGAASSVRGCSVADGCIINGAIENSVISRGVQIGEGAVVRGSVIMTDCVIEPGAQIENAIIDRNVKIAGDVRLAGTESTPVIIAKGTAL